MSSNTTATATKKAIVHIRLKDGVLDPQGVTIHKALQTMGYGKALAVRSGKFFEVEFADDSPESRKQLQDMCEKTLTNPVIETFTIQWL